MQPLPPTIVAPLLLLLATACASPPSPALTPAASPPAVASQPAEPQLAEPPPFVFDWRPPCRVPVEQITEKRDRAIRYTYVLAVRPGADANLEARMEDIRIVEVAGRDVRSPEQQAKLAQAAALARALPAMVITPAGELFATAGLDEAIEKMIASPLVSADPSKAELMARILRSPETKAMVTTRLQDAWYTWVEAWAGLQLAPGGVRELTPAAAAAQGLPPVHVKYEHHGVKEGGQVHLSLTSIQEGEQAVQGMVDGMQSLLRESGVELPAKIRLDSFRQVARMEALTDPTTLRPARTRLEKVTEVSVQGKAVTRREVTEDRFDWSRAEGCR